MFDRERKRLPELGELLSDARRGEPDDADAQPDECDRYSGQRCPGPHATEPRENAGESMKQNCDEHTCEDEHQQVCRVPDEEQHKDKAADNARRDPMDRGRSAYRDG